jgi:hypothetical protein
MLVSRRLVVGFCDCVWVFVTVCGFCWKFCDGVWFYGVGPRAGKFGLVTVSEMLTVLNVYTGENYASPQVRRMPHVWHH